MNKLPNIFTLASHRVANTNVQPLAAMALARQNHALVCHWILDGATATLVCIWSADDPCGNDQEEPILRLAN